MARAKKQKDAPQGSPAWMATFSDLMNLLLCFFVLLFSMSSVDVAKYEEVAASLSRSFSIFNGGGSAIGEGQLINSGIRQLNDLGELYNEVGKASEEEEVKDSDSLEEYKKDLEEQRKKELEKIYEEAIDEAENQKIDQYLEFSIDGEYTYVCINMNGSFLFESGSDELNPKAKLILDKLSEILKSYNDHLIKIEGHTDNVPISNSRYRSNLELSSFRAMGVFQYLVEDKKLDPKMLEASGRGEYDPIADNKTEEGKAKNRRVVFKIYSNSQKNN
ncbi:OmpA/MotB family protein [Anaeromicropila populeti]|uniref:Chemotaxis protein MotB n=1 Tax=Anaeromicropila populeti TaxID=37658 RepID=A0A1I6KXD5_9FIRM|nr:flagellar motor protein MotB [Anaeromicropila populeti]SFR95871.1 chemotaxis protein MotB [Anaeromicropila populeti]